MICLLLEVLAATTAPSTPPPPRAITLPFGFVDELVVTVGADPATFKFAPDGSMYVGERILGSLYRCTAPDYDDLRPMYTFDIPKDASGEPSRHRSSGLRDVTGDGTYLYAFYMQDVPRHNRVVRLTIDPADPGRVLPGSETVLLELPFNGSSSSGSHNGGAIEIGADGRLYVTTGDGWSGGDPVQSLSTYTGKVFRINTDGSIPQDNPFYDMASGPLRATYALGLRNPFAMSFNATNGRLYVVETTGGSKAEVFELAAAANFGHQGYGGIGVLTPPWGNGSLGGHLGTGGAWYDEGRFDAPPKLYFPAAYQRGFFHAMWGTNSGKKGQFTFFPAGSTTPEPFADEVFLTDGENDLIRPVATRVGPDGHLYYLLTDYETPDGRIHRVRFTGQGTVATPTITPGGGTFEEPVEVSLATTTPGATIHFTEDGDDPDQSDPLYTGPFVLGVDTLVKARAYKPGLDPSGIASAFFEFQENQPPVAVGGPRDVSWPLGRLHVLNGSASHDPDDDATLSDLWTQVAGPPLRDFDGSDFVSPFTPTQVGDYRFRLDVCDPSDACDADEVQVSVVPGLYDVLDGLANRWLFEESGGRLAYDSSSSAAHGELRNAPAWTRVSAYPGSSRALSFDGVDDSVEVPASLDPSGTELTITAWIRPDDFGYMDARILSKATGQQESEHYVMLSTLFSAGEYRLRFRLKTEGTTSTLVADAGVLEAGVWTHVAARYDGQEMSLYQDGVRVGQRPKSGTITSNPNVPSALGNQPAGASGGARPFDGLLDDVRVYDRALSAAELALLGDVDRIMQVAPLDTAPPVEPVVR